jgi:hypothetical protein
LAARAEVSITSVRELEHDQVRPSDRMCRCLAEGLAFDRDPVSVAVLDLRLQRAAGPSLRRWHRRRPPRVAVQRLYARAAAVLDAEDTAREAVQQAPWRRSWRSSALGGGPMRRARAARRIRRRRGRVGGRGFGSALCC